MASRGAVLVILLLWMGLDTSCRVPKELSNSNVMVDMCTHQLTPDLRGGLGGRILQLQPLGGAWDPGTLLPGQIFSMWLVVSAIAVANVVATFYIETSKHFSYIRDCSNLILI